MPTKLRHIHLQSVRPELLDVAWVVMVPAREATVGSPLRRQVFKIVQIELANYRGSFNTLIFGENKPSIGFPHEGRLGRRVVLTSQPEASNFVAQLSSLGRCARESSPSD